MTFFATYHYITPDIIESLSSSYDYIEDVPYQYNPQGVLSLHAIQRVYHFDMHMTFAEIEGQLMQWFQTDILHHEILRIALSVIHYFYQCGASIAEHNGTLLSLWQHTSTWLHTPTQPQRQLYDISYLTI